LNPRRTPNLSLLTLTLALWCLAPGIAASAGVTYIVDVDTSSLASTAGYLDFQFNPDGSNALAAAAVVTGFSGGSGFSLFFQSGDASGTLPGDLSFDNATPLNELTFGLTYGSDLSFNVTLSGAALGSSAPDGSIFALALYDGAGNPESNGLATAAISINPDGTTTGFVYPPIVEGGPTATVALASVPEPSSMVLASLGLAVLLGWYWARHRPAA
jgi:hypothetical protein